MPLPRSAGVAACATEVYAMVLQNVLNLQAQHGDGVEDAELLRSRLPYLRKLVSCCACSKILTEAMVSPICDHHYCYNCQFVEPEWPIRCRQCKERNGLESAQQIQMVVRCYHRLCFLLRNVYKPATFSEPDGSLLNESRTSRQVDSVTHLLREVWDSNYVCPWDIIKRPVPLEFQNHLSNQPVDQTDISTTVERRDVPESKQPENDLLSGDVCSQVKSPRLEEMSPRSPPESDCKPSTRTSSTKNKLVDCKGRTQRRKV